MKSTVHTLPHALGTPALLGRGVKLFFIVIVCFSPLHCFADVSTHVKQPGITGGAGSMDGLVTLLLRGLKQQDRKTLESIYITRDEYDRWIWPQLPVSKKKQWQNRKSMNLVWSQHHLRSTHGLTSVLENYGGNTYSLLKLQPAEQTRDYTTYKIYSDMQVCVKDASGTEHWLKLFGSIVHINNIYKIFSYNIR